MESHVSRQPARHHPLWANSLSQAEPVSHVMEIATRHAESSRGRSPVAAALVERASDERALGFLERVLQGHPIERHDHAAACGGLRGLTLRGFVVNGVELEEL